MLRVPSSSREGTCRGEEAREGKGDRRSKLVPDTVLTSLPFSRRRFVVSAKFQTWSKTASFQQAYKVTTSSGSSRRRLSSAAGNYVADGQPVIATVVDDVLDDPLTRSISLTVGLGRFDKTKDAMSGYLIGTSGTSVIFDLGGKRRFNTGGAVTHLKIRLREDIGTPTALGLISGGKDGLKFSSIEVDGKYVGEMKVRSGKEPRWRVSGTYVCMPLLPTPPPFLTSQTHFILCYSLRSSQTYSKCRGSKKRGTWNCEQVVPLLPWSDGGCKPECSASAQGPPPDLSVILNPNPNVAGSSITYDFGTVWNACNAKGSFRFTYTAKCDEGCEERYHSFYKR